MFLRKIAVAYRIIRSLLIFFRAEYRRGTLRENMKGIKKMVINKEMSWGELIAEKAQLYGNRTFLIFNDKEYSFREMNDNACRAANFFTEYGGLRGTGVAIFMDNSPRFLDVFMGIQKIGMYAVPVNTSLRGDSLLYILNHCDAAFLVIDEAYMKIFNRIKDRLENIKTVIVNPSEKKYTNGQTLNLLEAYTRPSDEPDEGYDYDNICFITYTSGTTGLPKGVVYRYRASGVKLLSLVGHMLYNKNDRLYTALKLFHGNALLATITCALNVGAQVVLKEKFSASRFWEDIRKYKITSFNTIGAMIPIIMKQPENNLDGKNKVRFVLSAACPLDLWKKFEKRYNTRLYEAYGAVDGGGKTILNLGTAPAGSIGKPNAKTRYRLVDSEMNDVPDGEPGELIFEIPESTDGPKNKISVEYYKNDRASREKSDGKWIFTGDLVKRDKKGYLYFIGRNTESMRIKGENVSAFEVEQTLQKHPFVLEAAVYPVPSELAEDEIMASVSLVKGKELTEKELLEFIKEDLPKYAVPRYIKIVEDFPKTETFRIKKKEIETLGIVTGTYDSSANAYL